MTEGKLFPIVVGFAGYARAGKDTCALQLAKRLTEVGLRCKRVAFADEVRRECWADNHNLRVTINGQAIVMPFRSVIMLAHASVRPTAQPVRITDAEWSHDNCFEGYQAAKQYPGFRDHLVSHGQAKRDSDPNYWVKKVLPVDRAALRAMYPNVEVIIYTDVRQENEARGVLALNGYLNLVQRPGVGPADDTEAKTIADVERLVQSAHPRTRSINNAYTEDFLHLALQDLERIIMMDLSIHFTREAPELI